MRKPISKHGLRRALEQAHADGVIRWDEPTGAVVDRIWHDIEKEAFNSGRKKPAARNGAARSEVPEEHIAEI